MTNRKKREIDTDKVVKFSETVNRLMKEQGITQAALANKLNISPDMLSKHLNKNGANFPDSARIKEIAQALGVSVDMLYSDYLYPTKQIDASALVLGLLTAVVELDGTIEGRSIKFPEKSDLTEVLNTYLFISKSAADQSERLEAAKTTAKICKDYVVYNSRLISTYAFFEQLLQTLHSTEVVAFETAELVARPPKYTEEDVRKALVGYAQFKTMVSGKIDELHSYKKQNPDTLKSEFLTKKKVVSTMLHDEIIQNEPRIKELKRTSMSIQSMPEDCDDVEVEEVRIDFAERTPLQLCLLALCSYFEVSDNQDTCIF